MKTYEKPKLIALSLAANDMLCSGCSEKTRYDSDWNNFLKEFGTDSNNNGVIEPGEFSNGLFAGSGDSCTISVSGVEKYCKFTASSEGAIALFTS